MQNATSHPEAPTACPFGRGHRRTVEIVDDVKSDAGNLIVPAGTVTYAWDEDGAGISPFGPVPSVAVWTPDHYAGIEWSIMPATRVANV